MDKLKFIKKPAFYVPAIIVVLLVLFFVFRGSGAPALSFTEAKRGEVAQEVDVTGQIKSADSVDLAFERGGKIKSVSAVEGKDVMAGQILISLDNSDLFAQLNEAEAGADAQEAKLEELKKGTRVEDLLIAKANFENAKKSLDNSRQNALDKISDAFAKADDAVRNKVDSAFTAPRGTRPVFNFSFSNSAADLQVKEDVEFGRRDAEKILVLWKSEIDAFSGVENLEINLSEAEKNLNAVKSFLDKVSLAISVGTPGTSVPAAYNTDVFSARTNVAAAISNLSIARGQLNSDESSLIVYQNQLALKEAGATAETIAAQQAAVRQARARADSIRAQIEKNIIRSPIDGRVAKVNANVGEIAAAGVPLVSIISGKQFEIEANITEADIARVKIGDQAQVTFDAYGPELSYQAKVIKIDLGATNLEGVTAYKTTLQFLSEDEKILEGLTANINIETGKKENVLYVPTRNIVSRDGRKFVKIVRDEKKGITEEIEVETGLRGSDGRTEIISGLQEGDKIISE